MHQKNTLLFALLILPAALFAQSFYVDGATGNNSNNGTSLATAWATIQKACNSASAGSTVYIRGGNYTESLWMNVTGTAGNYITFTAYSGETVVIDGGSTGMQTELLNIAGPDYIRFDGVTFAHATGPFSKGVAIRDGSDFIDIVNCTFHDIHFSNNVNAPVNCNSGSNANAFIVYNENATDACTNIIFSDNEVYDCRTGCSEACTFNGNVDGFTVQNNLVHDITNIGIDAAGGYGACPDPLKDFARNGVIMGNITWNCVSLLAVSAGIYIDGGKDIIVERNTSHDNGRGFEIGCEQQGHVTSGIILRNNICYHNQEAGIGIGGYDYPNTGKVINCEVRNNTFYNNAYINTSDGELLIEYSENCTVRQNVFYATNPVKRLLTTRLNSTGLALDYNLYYHATGAAAATIDWNGTIYTGYSTYQTATGKDAHSPLGNPLFTNTGSANFALQTGSPGINTGTPGFTPAVGEVDFLGSMRLVNIVDIGAFENQVPLSVEYLQPLTATVEGTNVLLRWSVTDPVNHSHFAIERSVDGVLFEKIGENHLQPLQTATTAYQFLDKSPLTGLGYYRLQQADRDGQFRYSPVVSVETVAFSLIIYPNPTSDFLQITATPMPDYYNILDQSGREVVSLQTVSGHQMDITALHPGPYWIQLFYRESGKMVLVMSYKL